MPDPAAILEETLRGIYGESTKIIRISPVAGGSINQSFRLDLESKLRLFCKTNSWSAFPALFEKEKSGLLLLGSSGLVQVPAIISCAKHQDLQFLVMEWIDQKTPRNSCFETLGSQLAALHKLKEARFGFGEDNFMGSFPQSNKQHHDWAGFLTEERLKPQLAMAIQKKLLSRENIAQFETVFIKIPGIFNEEEPCLLHGDLWSGNFLCSIDEQPVLIDPACYYGHRSMDLAMTTLFGGFGKKFYEAYAYHYPLPSNYREQWEIASLYPLLIHLNLFGSSYLRSILEIIRRFR